MCLCLSVGVVVGHLHGGLGQFGVGCAIAALGHLLGGTLYLLWMARRMWQTRVMATADESRLNITFLEGAAIQFLNIKAWMLALSLVAGWVAGKEDALERCLVLLPIMMLFGFVSNLTYALMGSLLRQWLLQGARLLVFNRSMSLALVMTAAWMLQSNL